MASQTVGDNIVAIEGRIKDAAQRAGRKIESVRLVAVSKRKPVALIRQAMAAGQTLFGESYIQEAQEKIAEIGRGVTWHFIGHLQSNKASIAAELFDCIETVDRLKLARLLDKHLAELGRTMKVLVQVNVGRDSQKAGVLPEEAENLCREIAKLPHLELVGLMTMPPYSDDPEQTRVYFRELRLLARDLEAKGLIGCHGPLQISMGMSGDFEIAIEEGATLVRVGTALFGERD
ncbi:MAG: YggS family pyridoxal phosphate-dependent enzyme [Desulfobulbaceae bacterium]|nr:YggS family pyridoxal phosphate-dependent enzyme [Desulfobulbaceae bacterium]HIJ78025.1 YggS family pyridoxal phosphate-dependent enzyme [Deltaproteobacteria bacterium]